MKFFKRVKKAEEMGITLPPYIMDEYKKQVQQYCTEQYSIDKKGNKKTINCRDNKYSTDVYSLIVETAMKTKVDKIKEAVKGTNRGERE